MQAPNKIYIQPRAHDGWFENNPNESFVEYIRKDAIVAEIERELKSISNATGDFAEGRRMELNNLLSFLRSLM